MQLTPRYGTDPLIVLHGSPGAIVEPVTRQARRLAEAVSSLTDEQLNHPSRCDGWSARDVLVHLETADSFWTFSVGSGLRGEPTQFLATFDPVSSPAGFVDAAKDRSTAEVLDRFVAASAAFVDLLATLDDDDWSKLAEAPPGHLSVDALAHHALWDSWVHERDVLLPLGEMPPAEPDEVAASLAYVAALAPAFAITQGSTDKGVLAIDVTRPDVSIVAEIGDRVDVRTGTASSDLCLIGGAVDLLEALSRRQPLDQDIPEPTAWMVTGLATVFDQT